MDIDNIIEKYEELEQYLELFEDHDNFSLSSISDGLKVVSNKYGLDINIGDKELQKLNDFKQLDKFIYHGSSGFTYKHYTEICISINHPYYNFLDTPTEWRTEPLRFRIGYTLCEVSLASPLFVLLFEPKYKDSDFQYHFHEFASLKILTTNGSSPNDDFSKGLFYLNSSILKKVGFVASVNHLQIDYSDSLDLYSNEIDDIFDSIKSDKTTVKPNLESVEPLIFYNQAQITRGDDKFLQLYRILEFFMHRARLRKLKDMRGDHNCSEVDILKAIDSRNEEKLLINLIDNSQGDAAKSKLLEYAKNNKLIDRLNINALGKALYRYRNSIVHAKETQIEDSFIPNPFDKNVVCVNWIQILDEIVIKVIRKYNKTSG